MRVPACTAATAVPEALGPAKEPSPGEAGIHPDLSPTQRPVAALASEKTTKIRMAVIKSPTRKKNALRTPVDGSSMPWGCSESRRTAPGWCSSARNIRAAAIAERWSPVVVHGDRIFPVHDIPNPTTCWALRQSRTSEPPPSSAPTLVPRLAPDGPGHLLSMWAAGRQNPSQKRASMQLPG